MSSKRSERSALCLQCILPETFPGISLDADGICNHCRKPGGGGAGLADGRKQYGQQFLGLLDRLCGPGRRGNRAYDVLMAYSGGKDSTYAMSLLSDKYGLRVLALSFDNGFLSETALQNIRRVTDRLGIDHILLKPKWELLKKIFRTASEKELYPQKTLERASTICTSCMGIVKSVCLKTAIEMHIPMIGYGWSPGQAPLQSSIMRTNPAFTRASQQLIRNPLREIAGNDVDAYFLLERHYADPEGFPYNIHPMAWEHYNEAMILQAIGELGWRAPGDTDSNSTNCLLNAFANEAHIQRYSFHPYAWEIANMVRDGVMSRDEGYRKIYTAQPADLVKAAREKLGLEDGS